MRIRVLIGLCATVALVALTSLSLRAFAVILKWDTSPVLVYINPQTPDVSADAAEAAILAGMKVWNDIPNTNFKLQYAGRTTASTVVLDGRNNVFFRNTASDTGNAIATTYLWSLNGALAEADVVFWDLPFTFVTGNGPCPNPGGAYIEDIAAHELGHVVGLNHSTDPTATMFPTYPYCSTASRTLAPDDIAGMLAMYSINNSPPTLNITSPADKAVFPPLSVLTVTGSALDAEEGDISSRITWSIDGGSSFSTASFTFGNPSIGQHTIAASIRDAAGHVVSRTISFSVANPIPPSGSTNVALASAGAVATASSSYAASYGPGYVIDGDRTGRSFWNDADVNVYPDILQIDFAQTYTISQVNVYSVQTNYTNPIEPPDTLFTSQYAVNNFSIEYWTGTNWTAIPGATIANNPLVKRAIAFSPVTTQKIRVVITRTFDGASRLAEVEAFTTGPTTPPSPPTPPTPPGSATNVALASAGGVVTASSFYSTDFSPAFVNDGNRAGPDFWNDATFNSFPDVVQIDFAATQTIGQVNVFSVQDNYAAPSSPTATQVFSYYGVTDFTVEYWTGSNWATIPGATVAANSLVWRAITFAPVTTQRIRIVITGAADGYSRLTEVEALTAGGSPPPPPPTTTNVAAASAGAVASASSFYSTDFRPAFVNDGNRAGPDFWNDATFNSFPDALQIDFAGTFTIGQVNVFSVQDNYSNPSPPTPTQTFSYYGVTEFSVQYWTGTAWATIPGTTVVANSLVWRALTFTPVTTQRIRVVVTGTADGYSRLTEVEALTAAP